MVRSDTSLLRFFMFLQTKAPSLPALGDLGLFLYDLSTLYDLLRLALDPAYDSYRFGKYPLYRGRRPLRTGDQLVVEQVREKDRLEVTVSVAIGEDDTDITVSVFRVLAAELEAVYGFPIDTGRSAAGGPPPNTLSRLEQRGALPHLETVLRRLERSSWQIQRGEIWIGKEPR